MTTADSIKSLPYRWWKRGMEGLALSLIDDLPVYDGGDDLGLVNVTGIAGDDVCVQRAFAHRM